MATQIPSSLEIAQQAQLRPIAEIAADAGLLDDEVDLYGRYKAKVDLSVLDRLRDRANGKLIGVTAMLEAHILHGNELGIDPLTVSWRRCVDMNDRALRAVVIGLGGRAHGYVRETGFDITAASEGMAITAVARDLQDLRKRLGSITVGYTWDGQPVTSEQLQAAGAMTVLLKDAIKPNLVQTLEGQPAFVHCGPFANIAHVADLVALKLADYVVTESGFGSDMRMEKFLGTVCLVGALQRSAMCLV